VTHGERNPDDDAETEADDEEGERIAPEACSPPANRLTDGPMIARALGAPAG